MTKIDRDFIIDQLEKVCSKTKLKRDDIEIVCPFHPDSNPSCAVHLSGHKCPVGTFNCWSCEASGPWSRLAEKLGLEHGDNYHPENPFGAKRRAMQRRDEEEARIRRSMYDGHVPRGSQPWEHGGFRELPEEFLVKVGAKRYYDDRSECYRIVFPVKNKEGVPIGSVARRLDDEKAFPWMNSPGQWATKTLYPIEILPKRFEKVVLVEGPYDALRLNYLGIPALSILGTQNWTERKVSILQSRGVKSIIICMDGDRAGRQCESKVFADLEGRMRRKRFRLPIETPSIDPGNMSMERVELLREFVG